MRDDQLSSSGRKSIYLELIRLPWVHNTTVDMHDQDYTQYTS